MRSVGEETWYRSREGSQICLKQLCDFWGQAHKWDITSRLYWFIYRYTEYLKSTLNGKKK